MNGLFLHTGNRLEALAGELSAVLARPEEGSAGSVFAPEIVLVQSLGMSRWVSLQLAERLGICMNCQFPFPQAWLDETLRALVPDMVPRELLSVERMTWKIYGLLPGLVRLPEFGPVRRFLGDGDAVKRYQLASRLANLFDQYLVYRPAMILDWECGRGSAEGDAAWQAVLWREVNTERVVHFAAALDRLPGMTIPPGRRISIFGISSLPPAQMEVFFHLAASRPVHLFLLAPSSEYHGDDLTPKQRARRGLGPEAATGNPLLASLGRLNAHFTELLLEADERAGHRIVDEPEDFAPPVGNTLLARLQRDILLARDPAASSEQEPLPVEADSSIQIHVCHSPMREVEVLYDQLLALLEADPKLAPREILVMAPDIEKYAPFIHAVFGCPEDPALRIPYSVADRHPRAESHIVDVFLRILELPGTRCTAPQLFSLLESEPFRRKFEFSESDLDQIREWIDASGIRWGIDAPHRESLGLPAMAETTWRHGLDRLLLGYAMAGGNHTLFEGILPLDDVEGSGAELLGRFCAAVEAIAQTLDELETARPLPDWAVWLEALLQRFFIADDRAEEAGALQRLRRCFSQLAETALAAEPVTFEVLREHLAGALGADEHRGRFLTGGVTFCALKPMRSIPAKAIWLLGMDDGAFPRKPQPLQFDLMARHWKLGDRSVREDDRYLFLEALVSARERLFISHVGRSERNNTVIPPSIVVSELLDYLEQAAPSIEIRTALVFAHPLQAFSPRYFEADTRLFSFSQANAAASRRVSSRWEPPFAPSPLAEAEPEERNVALDRLLEFIGHPAAFFLKHRLGVRLQEDGSALEESEPAAIGHFAAYGIRRELFEAALKAAPAPDARSFAARALVPPGSLGEQHSRAFAKEADAFHRRVSPLLGTPGEPLAVSLKVGEFTLNGRLDSIYGGRLVAFRLATLKPKDRLRAWVRHLVHAALTSEPVPPTCLIGSDEAVAYGAPESPPAALLETLLNLYWEGLRRPLPFFPEAAYAFAKAAHDPETAGRATLDARTVWEGGYQRDGEHGGAVNRVCFPNDGTDSLGPEFEALARTIFGPMLTAQMTMEAAP